MMNRDLLYNSDKLSLLLDSRSLDRLLSSSNDYAIRLLNYVNCELFDFVRSPYETDYALLNNIIEYRMEYVKKNNVWQIKIERQNANEMYGFSYDMNSIEEIGKDIFETRTLNREQKEAIKLVFIQAALNKKYTSSQAQSKIFITDNHRILKNRLWFESHIPDVGLNISTIKEAVEIAGLFLISRNEYYLLDGSDINTKIDRLLWYLYSLRSKLPFVHFNKTPIIDSLSQRFEYILWTIDFLGFEHYKRVDNSTIDKSLYYFSYFITLVRGIFDNLAIETTKKYPSILKEIRNRKERISLSPNAGRDFLKALRSENKDLRKHINKNVNLIKLVDEFREPIVHRDLPNKGHYRNEDKDKKWETIEFQIPDEIKQLLDCLGDKPQKYDPISEFGVFAFSKDTFFLEPYQLTKTVTKNLIIFINRYLELLGYTNFLEENKNNPKHSDFVNKVYFFEKNHLGF